ncbi:MAG: PepSY-associated TM helix domain-containing protein, partial [Methylococcales bacterium]
TLDCFVAFYLTLPRRRKLPPPPHAVGLKLVPFVLSPSATLKRALSKDERNKRTCMKLWPFALSLSKHELLKSSVLKGQGGVSWWRRWKPAWKIRWNKGGYKLNFDLHRAGGLWLWVVLLIFAWSSVGMNLWDTVYTWATRAVFEYKTLWTELPERAEPLQQPRLSWREAQTRGEQLMAELAEEHGFAVDHANALRLDRTHGVYVYQVRSSLDFQDSRRAATQVFFDAGSGEFKLLMLPSGQYTGNTVTQWLYALHTGTVFGLPYRIFVCFLGVIIVMLSITGIVIWMKKRRARRLKYLSANRRAEALGEHV